MTEHETPATEESSNSQAQSDPLKAYRDCVIRENEINHDLESTSKKTGASAITMLVGMGATAATLLIKAVTETQGVVVPTLSIGSHEMLITDALMKTALFGTIVSGFFSHHYSVTARHLKSRLDLARELTVTKHSRTSLLLEEANLLTDLEDESTQD